MNTNANVTNVHKVIQMSASVSLHKQNKIMDYYVIIKSCFFVFEECCSLQGSRKAKG